ncbi:MAG: DUF2071 domain-containing protein [Deltaproteobacteria bacterium]|nr:DUF2071 domain-containing protein [Deltaproteobacteria bacterium]
MPDWSALLKQHEHRPYPLPDRPWRMTMSWLDLLFAHWSFPPEVIRALLPPNLTLDTFEGRAWVGVVPFRMENVGPPGLNWLPGVSAFPELNVRTYVVHEGKPGVWFFSLDAASMLAVQAARLGFHLPYFYAHMRCEEREGWIHYESERDHTGVQSGSFVGRYRPPPPPWPRALPPPPRGRAPRGPAPGARGRAAAPRGPRAPPRGPPRPPGRPVGEVYHSAPGTLEAWLTERYCLYAANRKGQIRRGEIHHVQWPLQRAEAETQTCTVTQAWGIELVGQPETLHFVKRLDVVAWLLE